MHEPEPATVRAAAAGQLDAFEDLVRAYQAPVWRFLCRLLGDRALAEDVAQETFIRLHQRLHTFRFQSKFSTWVFQVARNAGLDAVRSRDRRLRLAEAAPPAGPAADPSAGAELAEALAALPTAQREALLVVEVLGLTYREAAVVLGTREGTVKSRVFHARERLAGWLAEEATGEV